MKLFRRKRRHRHAWSKWQVVPMQGVSTRTGVRFECDRQERRCATCGLTERREL